MTLSNIEKDSPSVAIGSYAAVLHALNGMDKDLLLVAKDFRRAPQQKSSSKNQSTHSVG